MSLEQRVLSALLQDRLLEHEGKEVTQVDKLANGKIRIYYSPFLYVDRDEKDVTISSKRRKNNA